MHKETLLLVLGIGVFVAPLLGIPESWRAVFLYGIGGCIVLIAILYRMEVRRRRRHEEKTFHEQHDPHTRDPLVTPR